MRAPLLPAIRSAAFPFLRTAWRTARQLFHEIAGAFFAVFAIGWAATAWREWRHGAAQWLIGLAIGFAVMMAAFAATSFLRAHRVR